MSDGFVDGRCEFFFGGSHSVLFRPILADCTALYVGRFYNRQVIENVRFNDVPDCIRLSNGTVEVTLATTFGPRILAYAFDGGENVLGWHADAKVETTLGTWRPYGGHRLWVAPENMPRSYAPDNEPVEVTKNGDLSVHLKGVFDTAGLQKEMTVTLAADGTRLTIDHRLTVCEPCNAAAWALTIMCPGGSVVIPNEPFAPYGSERLLPVRSLALWSYTDFTDTRWSFDKHAIRLRVDGARAAQQKIGILNKQGWAAYEVNGVVFTKRADYLKGATYPDMNSSFEVYTAGDFVEIETLSPITHLDSSRKISHRETWSLEKSIEA
jgi:hypothetical protein